MTAEYLRTLEMGRQHLVDRGVHFSTGLSSGEVCDIELRFGFRFPEDLRGFLQTSLPLGDGFPDWRGPNRKIWDLLRWPEIGICFDIGNGVFWWPDWGIRPQSDDVAIEVAEQIEDTTTDDSDLWSLVSTK